MAAASLLSAKFFHARLFRCAAAFLDGFDLVEQELARDGTILPLLSRGLAFHLDTRRTMKQLHARRRFVHVLSAMPSGADERFFYVRFTHAESRHAAGERIFRI